MPPLAILAEIAAERNRQDNRWGVQNHPDRSQTYVPDFPSAAELREKCDHEHREGDTNWTSILVEETMEAVEEGGQEDTTRLRKELIQVAAVAVAWIECLDRRTEATNNAE